MCGKDGGGVGEVWMRIGITIGRDEVECDGEEVEVW